MEVILHVMALSLGVVYKLLESQMASGNEKLPIDIESLMRCSEGCCHLK